MRHRSLLFLLASFTLLLGALSFPRAALAACRIGNAGANTVKVELKGNNLHVFADETRNIAENNFAVPDSQCKSPGRVENGDYTISCDTKTEIFARDSLVAPLCGASVELGKTNSTCWVCGGDLKCAGASFAVGESDESLFATSNREAIPENNINETWRVKNPPSSFKYNGVTYNMNELGTSGVVVCNSNVTGCGVQVDRGDSCYNAVHKDVTVGQAGENAVMCTRVDPSGGTATDADPTTPASNGEETAPGNTTTSCSVGNMASYIMPCTEGGTECEPFNASSFPEDHAWIAAVNNQSKGYAPDAETRKNFPLGGNQQFSIQRSNNNHLLFGRSGNIIRLIEDTTWANSEACADGSGDAIQRIYTEGPGGDVQLGANFAYNSMKCGETITSANSYNVAHTFASETPLDPNSKACGGTKSKSNGQNHEGKLNSTNKLIFAGPITCNGSEVDAVAIQVTGGAGQGEVFLFCKNQGLCSWFQNLDLAGGDPANWTASTDVCAGTGAIDFSGSGWACETPPQTAANTQAPWNQSWVVGSGLVETVLRTLGLGKTFFQNQTVTLPDIEPEANLLQNANPHLLPHTVKNGITWITNEFVYSANTILCHETSDNGNKFNLPDRHIITMAAVGLTTLTGNAHVFDAMQAMGTLAKNQRNLNPLYPPLTVNVRNALPCGIQDTGDSRRAKTVGSTGDSEYEIPEQEAPEYISQKWNTFDEIKAALQCLLEGGGSGCLAKDTGAQIQYNYAVPYGPQTMARLAKDTTGKPTGAFNTFRPHSIELNERVGEESAPNTIAQSLGTNQEPLAMRTPLEGLAAIQQSADMVKCATSFNRKRIPGLAASACNFTTATNTSIPETSVIDTHTWETEEPEREAEEPITSESCEYAPLSDTLKPPSGDFMDALEAAAAKEKVPVCVLAGVAHIEGGWRYTEKTAAQCKPANSCSATGPMQFTTGPQAGIDCTQCEAGYCPNAWKTYGEGLDNPCSYEDALVAAARLLKTSGLSGTNWQGQEDRIERSGLHYYGSSKGLCRTRDAEGNLRSYGQFLVDYCKNY